MRENQLESLIEQFTPMIHHMIRKLSIYKNKEEFFQIGLISIWETTHTFLPEKGEYKSYLYQHMRGRFLDELKKSNLDQARIVHPEEEFWTLLASPPLYKEEEYAIRQLCKPLTDCQTKWVIYTMVHQWTIKEIAEKEKVSLSAVKGWKKGALEKLRGILG
ncbi:sigma-70 family RNA polymerase sigma factor [Niallia nealsonii]|uniref:RNA polymerase subunit sigma-24 n=1 Tax=Niallia nealsonii TaxID=115979 RepID=A0A2N0Z756_9BACI|nr:sigma-70 family RNA polymerase sigma factor [Niallia nealsonii]PKG25349.1 RNA polymerase subunit sigma-24 [Niallia nealsonii]